MSTPAGLLVGAQLIRRFDEFEEARVYSRPKLRERRAQRLVAAAGGLFRGSVPLFYSLVRDHPEGKDLIAKQKPQWIVGDIHLENIGAIFLPNSSYDYDLNDFDEAVIGYPVWDVLRGVAACLVVASDLGMNPSAGIEAAEHFLAGYAGNAGNAHLGLVDDLLQRARSRTMKDLLESRAPKDHGVRKLEIGEKYLPLRAGELQTVESVLAEYVKLHPGRGVDKKIELIDTAFRVAGTGSLGVHRYALLLRTSKGDDLLLDAKEMRPSGVVVSGLTPRVDKEGTEAARVEGSMRALLGDSRVEARAVVASDGLSYLVRPYSPGEDKLDLGKLQGKDARLSTLASIVGDKLRAAHSRAGDGKHLAVDERRVLQVAVDLAIHVWRIYYGLVEREQLG
jgi:uncharacterized protein (DUF2252 family)